MNPNLKISEPKIIREALESMSDEQLIEFAKENDQHKRKGYRPDAFTQKIFAELFKRKGLGYKQLGHLSSIQARYIESLGIESR